jgi:hypothetical protein
MKLTHVEPILEKKVKIVFKDHDPRLPKIGRFVRINGDDDLSSKGMCRFVFEQWFENWKVSPTAGLTRIFVVADIRCAIMSEDGKEKIIG